MKRRVAPRLLTALIATVLVGSAAMPGAAVAETPDATTPEAAGTPTPQDQQPETAPSSSPEATPTPTPTPAPTPEKSAPGTSVPPVETPAPKSEESRVERDDSATPADADVMPEGPLKRCITLSLAGKQATLAETKKLTAVSVEPGCAAPGGSDPSDLPAMDDWAGATFLSGVTDLRVTGFEGVTVPRKGLGGLAEIEKLSLVDNQLTELPELGDLPELKSLDLADNDLTELTMPSVAGAPRLTKLDLSKNQISDISGVTDAAAGTTIIVTDQKLTLPDITARATQQLADVITVPDAWANPSWMPGENQMAAVNGDEGTFSAARPGAWSLSWTISQGKVSFSGSATGESMEPEPEQISFTKPGPVALGESATYRADVSNLPIAVQSELDYQWYRGSSKSELKPVGGATEQKFTIDSVSPEDDGTFVKLVATDGGAAHQSTPALLAVQPDVDDGFKECLTDRFGEDFDADDLEGMRTLDCSDRGILDLDDLPTIDGDGNVSIDLSNNLITELSRDALVTDGGMLRTKQLNLSDNQITDVPDLGGIDLANAPANLIVLDGNRISDVSGLGSVQPPTKAGPASISVRRQVVDLPAVDVDEPPPMPPTTPRPKASSVTGDDLPLIRDGQVVADPVPFPQRGVDALAWDGGTSRDVAFSGSFVVPVGSGRLLGLIFPTSTPTGGDRVTVRAYGFTGDTSLVLSAIDDELFDGKDAPTVGVTNGSGQATLTLGYTSGPQVVTATGQPSDQKTTFDFILSGDDVVDVPDDALRTCFPGEIGKPHDDSKYYRSQLNRISTDFSCRNKDVKDLTGLEALRAPSIDLTGNDVTSLETIPALNPATTSLSLNNNELDKLGAVANQPDLRRLNLSQNQLTNFSALDGVIFADDAEVLALGQTVRLPRQAVGRGSTQPAVRGLGAEKAELDFPKQATTSGTSVTWTAAGDFRVGFELRQEPENDDGAENSDDAEELATPGLELTGTFAIRVVNAAAPPTAQPPSAAPVQQVATAPRVPPLAPRRLVERVQRPDKDRKTSPRAVALGPKVALEETAPTPRTVTNPTVEKREPVTSVAGWGLTATGWSLLGAALLAMALAVAVAAFVLGRGTRGQS